LRGAASWLPSALSSGDNSFGMKREKTDDPKTLKSETTPLPLSENFEETASLALCESFQGFSRILQTHFSVSALECFLKSPEENRWKYELGIPSEPKTNQRFMTSDRSVEGSWLAPDVRGSLIHEALCLLTRYERPLSLKEVRAWLKDHPRLLAQPAEAEEEIFKTVSETFHHPHFKPILNAVEGYSEIPFLLSFFPYELQGNIDRLVLNEDRWRVVDYKTHRRTTGEISETPADASPFLFQIKTYCLAATRMTGRSVLEGQIYYVESNHVEALQFSEEEIGEHALFLEELMKRVAS
jgi:ATP-dependent exoDNAse (exonuclease V) beta subunit